MDQIEQILLKATVEEKVRLLTGHHNWYTYDIKRLRLPAIAMSDGPHGLRKVKKTSFGLEESYPATCFPPMSALAATFNDKIVEDIGVALGLEARAHNVHIVLGPGVNIKRNPLCGRNFEYFSEDPLLSGKLGAAMIRGIQSQGVGATVKHFLANNQEKERFISNSVIDERALHEIYLKPFEIAIKAGNPWALMTSYNRVNGKHVNVSPEFINGILRKKWNYQGLVMSDWGAYVDPLNSLKAGLDLQMPGGLQPLYEVEEALVTNKMPLNALNQSVARIAKTALKVHEVDPLPVPKVDYQAHFDLAKKAASEALVLLKNADNILPLKNKEEVLFVGPYVKKPHMQGGGSSQVNPVFSTSVLEVLKASRLNYQYIEGFSSQIDEIKDEKIVEIQELAKAAKKVILFLGLLDKTESEGYDRTTLSLPTRQNALVEAITSVNKHVVVVITAGAPVTMPWIDDVPTVLFNYLGGEASGQAIVDVLSGEVNPSGHLPETFPLQYEDVPSARKFAGSSINVEYRESIFVGYRYYERAKRPVLFPFGHGLSYTSFKYENLILDQETIDEDGQIQVSVDVINTGDLAGADVVQLYVSQDHPAIFRPVRTLKAFKKVFLKKGEKQTLKFTLLADDFSYYNIKIHDFAVENGIHRVQIGYSESDIELSAKVVINSTKHIEHISYRKTAPIYYNLPESGYFQVRFREFEAIFQDENIASAHYLPRVDRPFGLVNTLEDGKLYWGTRVLIKQVKRQAKKIAHGNPDMIKQAELTVLKMPLASMASMGVLSYHQVSGMLDVMNGKVVKGFLKIAFGNKKNKKKPKILSKRRNKYK
ncbi:MAG: beta-glucosidase [Bacilli bacterium]